MDKSNWVYLVITMCTKTREPLVNLATKNEQLAHEYMKSMAEQLPMFYITELK